MGNRYTRKTKEQTQAGPRRDEQDEGARLIACGRINKHGRETRVAFEFMGDLTKGAVRRVFSSTTRAEEIANA